MSELNFKDQNGIVDYEVVAKHLMLAIQIDNGLVNSKESEAEYDLWYLRRIKMWATKFFEFNPSLLADETIAEIALGVHTEKYQGKLGYKKLSECLNEYFIFLCV